MKHIVLLSGGKDSTATLLKVLENFNSKEIIGLFCDTGWEHPITYEYIDYLENKTGVKIYRTTAKVKFLDVIKNELPNDRFRGCNDAFKRTPTRKFIRQYKPEEVVLYYGVRKNESSSRMKRYKNILPDEVYIDKTFSIKSQKVYCMYPIIDWTKEQVFDYIISKGFYPNPLYSIGHTRVGCYPCVCANKKEIQLCLEDEIGRERIRKIIEVIGNNHNWENVKKRSANYYRMKVLFEKEILDKSFNKTS